MELHALFQDAVPADDGGETFTDAYFVADVRFGMEGLGSGSARVSPYAAVENLFDRRYTSSVAVNAFGGRYFEPGPGRTFRVGVDVTWGG